MLACAVRRRSRVSNRESCVDCQPRRAAWRAGGGVRGRAPACEGELHGTARPCCARDLPDPPGWDSDKQRRPAAQAGVGSAGAPARRGDGRARGAPACRFSLCSPAAPCPARRRRGRPCRAASPGAPCLGARRVAPGRGRVAWGPGAGRPGAARGQAAPRGGRGRPWGGGRGGVPARHVRRPSAVVGACAHRQGRRGPGGVRRKQGLWRCRAPHGTRTGNCKRGRNNGRLWKALLAGEHGAARRRPCTEAAAQVAGARAAGGGKPRGAPCRAVWLRAVPAPCIALPARRVVQPCGGSRRGCSSGRGARAGSRCQAAGWSGLGRASVLGKA